jgi:hypothetical protein
MGTAAAGTHVLPCRATSTLAMVSGMLVPAANKVRPITVSGIASVSPVINTDNTNNKSQMLTHHSLQTFQIFLPVFLKLSKL